MIKDNQQYFNRLHVVVDAFVIAGSYILAWYLYIGSSLKNTGPEVGVLDMKVYFSALYFVVPGYLICITGSSFTLQKGCSGARQRF